MTPKSYKVTHDPAALIPPILIFLSPWIASILFVLVCYFKTEIDEVTNTLWFHSLFSFFVGAGTLVLLYYTGKRIVNKMILKR